MNQKCAKCNHYHKDNECMTCTLLECMCDITTFVPELETKLFDYYVSVIEQFDTLYDKIKYMLEEIQGFKNLNNKQFIFAFWHYNNNFCPGNFDVPTYHTLNDPESIRRCKQKVVENNPHLKPDKNLQQYKNTKELAIMEWVIQ